MRSGSLIAPTFHAEGKLEVKAFRISDLQIGGYVVDRSDLERRFVVELWLDGYPTHLARAQIYDDELCKAGAGDGCYGFAFTLAPEALAAASSVEVRLANLQPAIAEPVLLAAPRPARGRGQVRWAGGLRLSGWLEKGQSEAARFVRAFVDGEVVAEASANLWAHQENADNAVAERSFALQLPAHFADGLVRRAQVVDDAGNELPGSPCAFVAFENGLERFLNQHAEIESERLRSQGFDRLIPQSLPFEAFDQWRKLYPVTAAMRSDAPRVAVVLIGETELEASIVSLEGQTRCTWVAGALPIVDGEEQFSNGQLKQFLFTEAADCEFVLFSVSGAVFDPDALSSFAQSFGPFPDATIAYSDIAVRSSDGRDWPMAFSAFDYERMLEQGYGSFLFATRMPYAQEAAARGSTTLYRLFNMALDTIRDGEVADIDRTAKLPIHVPGFLASIPRAAIGRGSSSLVLATEAHLRARGMTATVSGEYPNLLPAVRVRREPIDASITIIIPTRDRIDLLRPCISSLEKTIDSGQVEILILDNDSSSQEASDYFRHVQSENVRIARAAGPFNFAGINNYGASIAKGEMLLFLNNDTECLHAGWLEEMTSRMVERDVGAVGALLLWPSNVIQHAGVALGANFAATHIFNERMEGDAGYGDLLRVAHECSAVTAACLLTRKATFLDIGGFDPVHFPVNFNDVDYCLRLRASGYRIVFTPHAKLMHRGFANRGDVDFDRGRRAKWERINLRSAWGETLVNDPFYNPALSLDDIPFSALAWPPRSMAPRQPRSTLPRAIPPGF